MRTSVLLFALFLSAVAVAKPAIIDPGHDNTTYPHAQDAMRDGSDDHLLMSRNISRAARQSLISFKLLSAIPDHATNRAAEPHHHASRHDSPVMAIGLFREPAAWCEDGTHATAEEDEGAVALFDHATWIRTTWYDMSWTTPDRYSPALSSGLAGGGEIRRYTFGSSDGLTPDAWYWIDHPGPEFRWIPNPTNDMTDVNRFHHRRTIAAADSLVLDVENSFMRSAADSSGLRYDPDPTGARYNVHKTPFGWSISLFDYRTTGEFLWVASAPVTLDQLLFGWMIEFPMLIGVPTTFDTPPSPTELKTYGALIALFDKLTPDDFAHNGLDGELVSNVIKLVRIQGTRCP